MNMYLKSILFACLLAIVACSPQKKDSKEENSEAFEKAQEEVKDKISGVVKEMPAPSEIPFLLMETGADLNMSLIHDVKLANNYSSNNNEAAVNLGVYAADIGYLSAYEKSQEALKYITEVRPLADQLALSGAFDPQTVEKFEKNLSNSDSLAMIVNEAVNNADDHLRKTDRPKVAALLLAGSFIEGLYIATALVENYPNELPDDARALILVPLVDVIIKQEEPLVDLIELLESVEEGDEYISTLVADLKGLQAEYKKLNVQQLMDEGNGAELLKDETLDNITNQMGKIRDDVTG
ncbi:hypothetical protein QYS48_29830 [Marivirga arenosa]|uniref:Uncharacterized protein n=1 Tax=Marivirga arenosa TaxID=3059076 RepID=A0AA51RDE4_9BACT|nr:hypothetical protein [Marivirga sp. ABR2-2]WMN07774.1 hypothetical protein QYS48_29830 [Marivirga sp. ABR2-2]